MLRATLHAVAAPLRGGLTQALAHFSEIIMSELRNTLIATVLGGALALGGVALSSWMDDSRANRAEKREKLEALMDQAIQLQSCSMRFSETKTPECEKGEGQFRLVTLAYLYFPELIAPTGAYSKEYLRLKSSTAECGSFEPSRDDAKTVSECLYRESSKSKLPEHLQELAYSVRRTARKIQ